MRFDIEIDDRQAARAMAMEGAALAEDQTLRG